MADAPMQLIAVVGIDIGKNSFHVVGLALQLLFLRASESMGNHDSNVVDASSVD